MATRNPYMSGSPYPTGRAPLELNLDEKIFALTQQMVKNRKDEIKQNMLTIDKNEAIMLDALDFEPLEGAGDIVAAQHAERLKGMEEKWARVFKDRQGKLTTQDKLLLGKEKREVEQGLKTAAADIAQVAEIKKNIGKGIYDDEQTSINLTEYQKAGLIGSGKAINIPVLKKQPFGAEFEARYTPFLEKRAKEIDSDLDVVDPATGKVSETKNNYVSMAEAAKFLQSTPEYQDLLTKDPARAAMVLNKMIMQHSIDSGSKKIIAGLIPKTSTATDKDALTESQQAALDDFETTSGGLIADSPLYKSSFMGIKSKYGTIESVGQENGKLKFTFAPVKDAVGNVTIPKYEIDLPTDPNDAEQVRIFKQKLWEVYPESLKKGLTTKAISGYLSKGKKTGTVQYQKPPDPQIEAANTALVELSRTPNKDTVKKTLTTLKESYPDLPIKINSSWIGSTLGVDFQKKGEPGYKTYLIKDKGRMDDLIKDIQEYVQPRSFKLKGYDEPFIVPYKDAKKFEVENKDLIENG
jgi:hypothetical protein